MCAVVLWMVCSCGRTAPKSTAPTPPVHTERVREATLRIVGDVMQHTPQIDAARTAADYDYAPCFEPVKEWLSNADLTIANLETTLRATPPYSGYPQFAAPSALAFALADAGVDVALLANNHICDRGRTGIINTIAALDSAGLRHTGAYCDLPDYARNNPLTMTVGGFRIAILNYTYGTNGIVTPRGVFVNRIDTVRIAADMERAATADIRVVCVHWGEEYHTRPSKTQRELAEWLFRKGATVIMGGHPHVVQPVEVLTDKWGRVRGVTFFSLGNYVSNQTTPGSDGGMVATLRFRQVGQEPIEISADWDFVWTHRYRKNGQRAYRILPLDALHKVINDSTVWRANRFRNSCRRFQTADTVIVGREFGRLN